MEIDPPTPQAQALLRVIVEAIRSGAVQAGKPETFLSYSGVLARLGERKPWVLAGHKLTHRGLTDLNCWTMEHDVPQVGALIVNKSNNRPSDAFPESHGWSVDDPAWEEWWLAEAKKAIEFDWSPYVVERKVEDVPTPRAQEPEEKYGAASSYASIITVEPGRHGGRPTIRGMRITVGDILGWLAAGMDEGAIISDHPELTKADVRAALAYAAERENQPASSLPGGLSKLAQKWAGKFTLPDPDPSDPRLTFLLERYAEKP